MKIIRFVGRLTLAPLKDRLEGLTLLFGEVEAVELSTRYNAIVTVGKPEGGQISSIQIIFGQEWDGNTIELYGSEEHRQLCNNPK